MPGHHGKMTFWCQDRFFPVLYLRIMTSVLVLFVFDLFFWILPVISTEILVKWTQLGTSFPGILADSHCSLSYIYYFFL